jgi:hypothetical protein
MANALRKFSEASDAVILHGTDAASAQVEKVRQALPQANVSMCVRQASYPPTGSSSSHQRIAVEPVMHLSCNTYYVVGQQDSAGKILTLKAEPDTENFEKAISDFVTATRCDVLAQPAGSCQPHTGTT